MSFTFPIHKPLKIFLGLLLAVSGIVFYFGPKLTPAQAKNYLKIPEIKTQEIKIKRTASELAPDLNAETQINASTSEQNSDITSNNTEPSSTLNSNNQDTEETRPMLQMPQQGQNSELLQAPDTEISSTTNSETSSVAATEQAPTTTKTPTSTVNNSAKKNTPQAQPVAMINLPAPLQKIADTIVENSLAGFWQTVSFPYNYGNASALTPFKTNLLYMIALSLAVIGILLLSGSRVSKRTKKSDKLANSLRQAMYLK